MASTLTLLRPQLRSVVPYARRACMSTLPGSSGSSNIPEDAESDKKDEDSSFIASYITSKSPKDGPPVGPRSAYGPAKPTAENPLTQAHKEVSASDTHAKKPLYGLHVLATPNNTIVNFTYPDGRTIKRVSGGTVGFKGQRRNTFEAGYKVVVETFKPILEEKERTGDLQLALYLKGFGQGRDAAYRALLASEGEQVKEMIKSITDKTPIAIGGPRAKKMRR